MNDWCVIRLQFGEALIVSPSQYQYLIDNKENFEIIAGGFKNWDECRRYLGR